MSVPKFWTFRKPKFKWILDSFSCDRFGSCEGALFFVHTFVKLFFTLLDERWRSRAAWTTFWSGGCRSKAAWEPTSASQDLSWEANFYSNSGAWGGTWPTNSYSTPRKNSHLQRRPQRKTLQQTVLVRRGNKSDSQESATPDKQEPGSLRLAQFSATVRVTRLVRCRVFLCGLSSCKWEFLRGVPYVRRSGSTSGTLSWSRSLLPN